MAKQDEAKQDEAKGCENHAAAAGQLSVLLPTHLVYS